MVNIGQEYIEALPVGEIAAGVNALLADNSRLVVTGPPGSGKSTLLPLTIASAFGEGRIVMLEPRRAAARQIAMRMAEMIGERVGDTVGYAMRFEKKMSAATRILVVTEGVMERMLVDDPTLDGVCVVIFDEFHERSLTSDLTLALTLEAQNVLRPDLRIVLMSATIDTDALCRELKAPVIEARGKMYDVRIINSDDDADPADCVSAVASAVMRACREQQGNVLAFLPGQGEIVRCADLVASAMPDAVVMPLYGMLPAAEQYRALEYNPAGRRKIVLATPIAETSLTIGGITAVVDSGLCRSVRFEPSTGLSRLVTERITLDMARQRAGRAGRLAAGVCYRLWTRATEHRMKEARTPEILEADLSAMVLDIAAWGGGRAETLPWLTPPPARNLTEARRLLTMLGALDSDGLITPHGRRMSAMPCHPRIANMLVSAPDERMKALGADIAALLEEKDPVNDENDADINTRIDMLRQLRRRGSGSGSALWRRIMRVAEQYRRMARCGEDNTPVDPADTGRLLASAYPERVAMRLSDGVYRIPGGENVRLNDADNLTGHDLLAIASMGRRVFLASPVNRETLLKMSVAHDNVSWNSREGRLVARREMRIGVLVIATQSLDNPDRDMMVATIARAAVKEGRSMFDFGDDVTRLLERIATVARWHPELGLPEMTVSSLLETAPEWLPLYIGRATTVQELRKIDMCAVISGLVGYEAMAEVDRVAPTHLCLPGGRNVRIDYRQGSELPVVSARLQDCLGLYDTPRLDGGQRPVLMELLSPGFKPVQLTQDLRGFWTGTYFEVRKELKRRYPRHRWPDNPLDYVAEQK